MNNSRSLFRINPAILSKIGFAVTLASALGQNANAATNWNGATQDWNTLSNWTGGSPDANDVFVNIGGAGNYPIVTGTSLYAPTFLHVAYGTSGTPTGQLVVNGTLTTGGMTINDAQNVSTTATGMVIINSGGTLNSTNDTLISFAGSGSSSGELQINTGGTFNIGTTAEKWLIVNQWDTAQGRINVNGGALNLQNGTDIRFSTSGGTGTSFITLSNGGAIAGNATSVIDLNRAGAAVNNTINLDGGTLTIGQIVSTLTSGTRAFNFNGGTLKAAGASTTFFAAGAASAATVKSGGAVIDSNGFDVTIGQALIDGTGGGGLTKLGAGKLTLGGVNTYTGSTTINSGTLSLGAAGSIASTTIRFNLTNSTAGQLEALNTSFSFNGTLSLGLAPVTASNSWTLFTGSAFGPGDLNLAAVTSDLGAFSNSGGTWTFSNGSGSWSFSSNGGTLSFTAVPEPGTYAIAGVLLGLAALHACKRRSLRA